MSLISWLQILSLNRVFLEYDISHSNIWRSWDIFRGRVALFLPTLRSRIHLSFPASLSPEASCFLSYHGQLDDGRQESLQALKQAERNKLCDCPSPGSQESSYQGVELLENRKASERLFEQVNLYFFKIYENFNSHFRQYQKPGAGFSRTLDNFIKVNHSGLPTDLKG